MSQNQKISTMFTVQGMRKFVCDRLTEVAQEILGAFEKRAQEYELELERQRKLLETFYAQANSGPGIKEEQQNIRITESQQPTASTSVQGVHSELQSSHPREVQNAERKERASTSKQGAQIPIHAPSGTKRTPAKYNKCSHGYRIPKRYAQKQNNTNTDHGNASAPVEIIEIDDNSPVSSDVEIMQDDEQPTTSQNVRETSQESKKLKPKSGKKSSPPSSHTPAQDNNTEATALSMETETTADNTENEPKITEVSSLSLDVSTQCSKPVDDEENTTLPQDTSQNEELMCEDFTGDKTQGKLLHENCKDDQSEKENPNNPSKNNDSMFSRVRENDGTRALLASTEQKISNNTATQRRFKCNWCNKKFVTRTSLKRHSRIHTGARSHECSVCHKSFATSTDTKVHCRIHSGKRLHKCEHCGQDFSSWMSCKRHKRTHKSAEPQVQ
ncbi:zinc finger protein 397-like [Periophthalmus magnuspinnatus]|uniref:zinc finger protein 397-like n=1 Tax=Periophthalmus magnuspinnatus TaxID=409849 RepID=UPI0024368AEA|nr:zinc finger protein 397-like [Periophthalmus magnuspinnatus]